MLYIAHRINSSAALKSVPFCYGIELDLRDRDDDIIIAHDPCTAGELFGEYIKNYSHAFMILNVKSERIERLLQKILVRYGIERYFFLDSSFPMIYSLSKEGESRFAVRFSEFETIETPLKLAGKIEWVWIDCFTKLPLDEQAYMQLKRAGLKLCLVSPDLQGRPEEIEAYARCIRQAHVIPDAICTKVHNIARWQDILGI